LKSGEIVPFYEVCPTDAEEMLVMPVRNHPHLPDGDYGLIDGFCADPDCDCRVIYIFVVSESRPGVLASITFGWEPLEFYRKWMRSDKIDDVIRDLKGPALMPMAPQTEFSHALLALVALRLKERSYVDFLKRHYRQFKDAPAEKRLGCVVDVRKYRTLSVRVPAVIHVMELMRSEGKEGLARILNCTGNSRYIWASFRARYSGE